jgi:hypothetical protein
MNAESKAKLEQTVKQQLVVDEALRNIFKAHFHIDGDNSEGNPGYKAYALYAVEVGVSLANIILAANHPESGRAFRAMTDLTYALNANEFWLKNAPVLVPVLTIILNSHKDYVDMAVQRQEMNEYAIYDKLMGSARIVALEIFSMVLYLVGGPQLMGIESLPLKNDLAPYFLG